MINTDESSTQKGGGAGVVITSPKKDVLKYGVQLKFPITNNTAKYEALLTGLRIAWALGAENIVLKSDSARHRTSQRRFRSKRDKNAEIPQIDEPTGEYLSSCRVCSDPMRSECRSWRGSMECLSR